MHLIGLSGKKFAGKDTVADMILELLPHLRGQKFSFAYALKKEVCAACDITMGFLEAHKENFRLILQGWGTDYRRELYGQDYWIEALLRVLVAHKHLHIQIVTDVRFRNEAEAIRKAGGLVWRIGRPTIINTDTHISETDLDYQSSYYDCLIVNDSNLKQLKIKVQDALSQFDILKQPYSPTTEERLKQSI